MSVVLRKKGYSEIRRSFEGSLIFSEGILTNCETRIYIKNDLLNILQNESKESNLSLSQRAYIIAERQREMYSIMIFITSVFIPVLFAVLILVISPDLTDPIDVVSVVVGITLVSLPMIHTITNLRYQARLLEDWRSDYLEQSYILVFETTPPSGNTNGEKILNLATAVFPEMTGVVYTSSFWLDLRYIVSYLKGKFEKLKKHKTIPKTLNYKLNSYLLDLVLETDEGLFIVKDFRDIVVTLNDLNHLSGLIVSHFKKHKIFRVICVAKEFDQSFFDKELLERQLMNLKTKFPIDFLIEEKIGYSVLWIGS